MQRTCLCNHVAHARAHTHTCRSSRSPFPASGASMPCRSLPMASPCCCCSCHSCCCCTGSATETAAAAVAPAEVVLVSTRARSRVGGRTEPEKVQPCERTRALGVRMRVHACSMHAVVCVCRSVCSCVLVCPCVCCAHAHMLSAFSGVEHHCVPGSFRRNKPCSRSWYGSAGQ